MTTTMNIYLAFFKRLLTTILSTFDIVSDLVNSCDFLGYEASVQIKSSIFGGNKNVSIPKWYVDTSKMCGGPNFTSHEASTIVNEKIIDQGTIKDFQNSSSCFDDRRKIHTVWGSVAIVIMLIPGIMTIIMTCSTKTKYEYFTMRHGTVFARIRNLVALLMFPLTVILFQIYGVFSHQNTEVHGFMAIGVALEAFLESFLQLVLQMFTICYGYEVTTTQVVTICASFVILSKASIDLDLEMYEHELTFCGIVVHFLKMIPAYCTTIAFRAVAFAVTLAFLRVWALIPMILLMIELIVTYRVSFGTFGTIDGCGYSPFVALMITNLGVTNVGMIGATENIGKDEREDGSCVSSYIEPTNRFIRFSSFVSYLHHAIVLSGILGLLEIDQNYFEHWKSPTFILKNYDQTFYVHRFYIFVGICGMGLIGLLLSFSTDI